jgi:polyisoprenoid-binding protein YceI
MLTHRDPFARVARPLAAAAIVLTLAAGCASRGPEPTAAPAPVQGAAQTTIPAGARVYDVDSVQTAISIRVYRAGPLARLGHNHVITAADVSGVVWQGAQPASSGFELRIPVRSFVVDDARAREIAGADFAGEVPADAREGTRQNLMRPEVLDAGRYPEITVRADGLGGTWEQPLARAVVTLKGQARPIDVPLTIERSDERIVARGAFRLRQSDFGMTPFSVAGGAIQVADELDLVFEVVATARPGSG